MRVRPVFPVRRSRTQQLIAAIVPALIVVLSISGFVWAQKRVTVVVDGRVMHVKSQADNVGGVLDETAVAHDRADIVTPSTDSPVIEGMTVVVRHSVPVVLDLAGERLKVDVVGETVADALVAAGANPSDNADVKPALGTKLKPGMTITAPDVFVRITQEQVAVPFGIEEKPDPTLAKGTRRVVAEGAQGASLRVFRVLVTGGVEGAPRLIAEQALTAPTPQVVAVGTGDLASADDHSTAERPVSVPPAPSAGKRLRVVATGYAAGSGGADTRTATGHRAVRGVVAVDPRFIPLGTRMYIPGYGYAVARDTGGAIKGGRVDLCFNCRADAMRWGRRPVTVIIVD
jgi:uncharacterized protein YabE (DUF348 family)/3D (Asp-Asp-Asp) domain-containing protein